MYIKVEEMKKIVLLLALFCMTLSAAAIKKTKLSVLYVGGHSDMETFGEASYDSLANAKSIVARTQAWKNFLETYFTTVKVEQGKDYNYRQSYDYDVTIIDGDPKPLEPRKMIYKNGRVVDMVYANISQRTLTVRSSRLLTRVRRWVDVLAQRTIGTVSACWVRLSTSVVTTPSSKVRIP